MKQVKFIHLTDTHMNAPHTEGPFVKHRFADKVKQVFAHVQQSGLAPSFVLITGDLSHEGNAEDYAYIRTVLDECSALVGAPVYVVLGNHDHRSAFRQGYLGETPSEEAYYYSVTIDGLRLIGLNSQTPGKHSGELDEAQLAWLDEQLSTTAPLGTIVGIHHPLLHVGGMSPDHLLANMEAIGQRLRQSDVVGIMAGHVHSHNVGRYQGVLSVAASGTAFAGEIVDKDHFRMYHFCSYNIVSVHPDGVSVQTVILPDSNAEIARFQMSLMAAQH
ncbi:metallophosphoesterase family protein [Paenibacillus mesophilus]|uniref:metallophosphoesterase family protein n=1 Tax=Paenibacillus mesophilus TaxID=2582849 RepID=UPI00130510E6|nr:metallophosphoesterase [Paenibacillus mesophilus]